MISLIHDAIGHHAKATPNATALLVKDQLFSYQSLWADVNSFASGLAELNLERSARIAIYLPKQAEAVISFFGTSLAGCTFVPVNSVLKPKQVAHILKDSGASVLVTSADRAKLLSAELKQCSALHTLILTGKADTHPCTPSIQTLGWEQFLMPQENECNRRRSIDTDIAAILYTSGSTGKPKGVVLSHRNMVAGAESVASYLENTASDRLLAVLPFSFDYGLSQLTTAFSVGASVVLMEYLLPRDVIKSVIKHEITGLAAVPPLWKQLALLEWPKEATQTLRYITNSGGAMPVVTTHALQRALPTTDVFLMYGLTEAFRSTYLPPDQVEFRPSSMGKAIPNAEVIVVRADGSECEPNEAGELVHLGPLVAMGYWNDPIKTAERFRPIPNQAKETPSTEIAVWSGDQVKRDAEGYLYFVTREDEMIKTSGYRVSPNEVEEEIQSSGLVTDTAVFGLPHPMLGQGIVVAAETNGEADSQALLRYCRRSMPNYQVPLHIEWYDVLPRNPNGKIDRNSLRASLSDSLFEESTS